MGVSTPECLAKDSPAHGARGCLQSLRGQPLMPKILLEGGKGWYVGSGAAFAPGGLGGLEGLSQGVPPLPEEPWGSGSLLGLYVKVCKECMVYMCVCVEAGGLFL